MDDARVLLHNKRYSAAYYVAGYVVECALKACLAKKAKRYEFPPKPNVVTRSYYTHDLQQLAEASDLSEELKKGRTNVYWTTVKDWGEDSRYDPHAGAKRANDILRAIEDPVDGVLQCIKRFW